jgi:hypothetical protein
MASGDDPVPHMELAAQDGDGSPCIVFERAEGVWVQLRRRSTTCSAVPSATSTTPIRRTRSQSSATRSGGDFGMLRTAVKKCMTRPSRMISGPLGLFVREPPESSSLLGLDPGIAARSPMRSDHVSTGGVDASPGSGAVGRAPPALRCDISDESDRTSLIARLCPTPSTFAWLWSHMSLLSWWDRALSLSAGSRSRSR